MTRPRRHAIVAAALAAALAAGANARGETIDFGSYHALLIANQDYEYWPDLRTPGADVAELEELLRDGYGFEVRTLRDAARAEIIDTIEQLKRELTDRDNLLIYYAGHGKLRDDGGYWIGVDAATDSRSLWINAQEISSLLDSRSGMRARHVMVIADSCYSGALLRAEGGIGERPPNQPQEAWWARMNRDAGRTALTSGGTEPVVDSVGESRHSIFADELIRALRSNEAVLEGSALYQKIKAEVHARAQRVAGGDAQAPDYGRIAGAGHEGGDFLFVRAGHAVPLVPAAAPSDIGGIRGEPESGAGAAAPAVAAVPSHDGGWSGRLELVSGRSRACSDLFSSMDVAVTVSGDRLEGVAEGRGFVRLSLPFEAPLSEGGAWSASATGSTTMSETPWVMLHIDGDLSAGTGTWRDSYNSCGGRLRLSRVD